jgi:hypothetical protein
VRVRDPWQRAPTDDAAPHAPSRHPRMRRVREAWTTTAWPAAITPRTRAIF